MHKHLKVIVVGLIDFPGFARKRLVEHTGFRTTASNYNSHYTPSMHTEQTYIVMKRNASGGRKHESK